MMIRNKIGGRKPIQFILSSMFITSFASQSLPGQGYSLKFQVTNYHTIFSKHLTVSHFEEKTVPPQLGKVPYSI